MFNLPHQKLSIPEIRDRVLSDIQVWHDVFLIASSACLHNDDRNLTAGKINMLPAGNSILLLQLFRLT